MDGFRDDHCLKVRIAVKYPKEKGNTQRTNLKYYRIFPDLLVSNTQYTEDCGFQIAPYTKGTI